MKAGKILFIFISFILLYTASNASLIHLTVEEKAFIKNHPTIKVANEKDWPPFNYNHQGQAKGLSIEYLNLLFNKVGIKIEFIQGQNWGELLTLFQRRQIDVIPAIYKDHKRLNYTLFTTPYYKSKLAIFATKDNQMIEKVNDLSAKQVGIETFDASIDLIKKHIPTINLVEIDTNIQLIRMLSTGKLDAIIVNPLVFKYYSKDIEVNNINFVDYINMTRQEQNSISLHFGIRKDWPVLHRIMQKLIDTTTNKEMREIEEKWIGGQFRVIDSNNVNSLNLGDMLTQQELQFLESHADVNVHMEDNYTPFSNIENNDKFIGYSIDYANMIAARLGIRFHYNKSENWEQAISHLKTRQIDIIAQMINTKKRQKFALFTDDYMTYYQAIVVKKNNIHLDTVDKLRGKKLALIKGYNIEQLFKKANPDIEISTYTDNQALLNAVRLGKVDAAISTHQVMQYNINALFFNDIISIPILNTPFIPKTTEAFGIRNDWPLMHSALQKAFASISSKEITDLQLKWFGQSQNSFIFSKREKNKTIVLSTGEKTYLAKKENIIFCVDPDWMPFEKIEAGQHIGMSADYLKMIKEQLSISLKLMPTSSWTQSLEYIKTKKCDILSLVASTPSREKYINFTSPYIEVPLVIATKPEVPFIANFKKLENKKIGISKDYAFKELLNIKYPNLNIISIENRQTGLEKVIDGELFGYIGTLFGIGYMFQNQFVGELKIAGKFDQNIGLSFGIRDDDLNLLSIFEKFVQNIDEEKRRVIFNKHIAIRYEKGFDYTLAWQISVMAFILLFASFYWNKKLALTQKKLIEQVHRDPLTNLYNRRYFHEVGSDLLSLYKRNKSTMSTIMIDIDKFKQVNDTYGHSIGDEVLINLAKLLGEHTRASDIIARFGGEEFVILLPNTDKKGAFQIASKLLAVVEQQTMPIGNDNSLKYTISLGVDSVHPDDQKIDQSLNRADKAMYQAKNNGRNRVVLS
ncbi:MAG: transporter substrate-binding domain-containing protein [Pseudomonadota bacterium]